MLYKTVVLMSSFLILSVLPHDQKSFKTTTLENELCLSFLLRSACPCWAVPVFDRVQLCWPLRVSLLFRNRILTLIPIYGIRGLCGS